MEWWASHRFDPLAARLADRHYTRQKPGTPQFVPPGRECTLRTETGDAVWTTSWPLAVYVRHAWAGAWVCSLFRNESALLSSALIRQAVAATLAKWPQPPVLGIVTFVDARKIRHKRDPGRCFRKAGWSLLKEQTKGGLLVLQLLPEAMPSPEPARGSQYPLFAMMAEEDEPGLFGGNG